MNKKHKAYCIARDDDDWFFSQVCCSDGGRWGWGVSISRKRTRDFVESHASRGNYEIEWVDETHEGYLAALELCIKNESAKRYKESQPNDK